MIAVAFVVLLVVVPPAMAWHFAGYFDGKSGESRYARWSREEAERRNA